MGAYWKELISMKYIKYTFGAAVVALSMVGGAVPSKAEPASGSVVATAIIVATTAKALDDLHTRNGQIASRQSSFVNRAVAQSTGISIRAIRKHGVFGGRNSFFRKPFG